MKKSMLMIVLCLCGIVNAAVITFDNYTTIPGTAHISNGYEGFNWGNFSVTDASSATNSGYPNSIVSGNYSAYNEWGSIATMSSNLFDFNGAYLTGAWNDGLNVEIKGFLSGSEVYSRTVVVNTQQALWFDFDFTGIDSLSFRSYGGVANPVFAWAGGGNHFAMDNFTYSESVNVVPAPGAALLAGIGSLLTGVLYKRKTL